MRDVLATPGWCYRVSPCFYCCLFLCIFTRHFNFSNSLSIFSQFQKQHFARLRHIGVTPKKEICHFFFSLTERHFFMHCNVPFPFFKVPFVFPAVPKPAFCKQKADRGTPKGRKMSLLFFSNRMAFFHIFLPAISVFQHRFRFCLPSKSSILQVLSTWGYPKRRKMSLLFLSNKKAFFHAFLRAISFFQNPFRFCLPSKSSILQG